MGGLGSGRQVKHDLDGLASLERREAFFEALERHDVRDDRLQVDAPQTHERLHLIPRLPHAPAEHADHRDALEHHVLGEIEGAVPAGDPQPRRAPAVTQRRQTGIERDRIAAHLQQDVGAVAAGLAADRLAEVWRRGGQDDVGAHDAGQRELVRIRVDGDDLRSAGRSRHADGHEPDRPGAGDQDGLQTDVTDRNSVDRVADRVEDGGPFIRHAGIELPDVALGHGDVVGETAVAIHADHFDGGADVRLTRATQETGAVRDVAFGRHALADAHAANGGADRGDDAHEFMPDDQRRAQAVLRPRVPGPDVRVGAADAGLEHADEHVVGTDRGNRHFAQSHAGTGPLFDECTHAARDVVPRSRGANWLRYGHKSRIFGQHFWIAFANFVP